VNAGTAGDFAQAGRLHAAGRLDEAIAIYRHVLESQPAHAEAHYRLGIALCARREFSEAARVLTEATRLAPGQVAAWAALGLALRESARAQEALDAFAHARSLDAAFAQVNGQMGIILQSMGRLQEAINHFAEEEARFPKLARNANNLGMALLQANREGEALEAFTRAVRAERDYVHAHANLAAIFHRRGDLLAAEAAYREVLRLAPDDAPTQSRLGHILTTMWRAEEAEPHLRRAIELDPGDRASPRTLAYVLRRLNRVQEARAVAQSILAKRPDDLQAAVIEKLALPAVYSSVAAVKTARKRYTTNLAALTADIERYAADPAQVLSLAWENFHLAYQGGDDRVLQAQYADFLGALIERAAPRYREPRAARKLRPAERLRVGLLSSFFRDCTAGKYFRSWATQLDRSRFDVFVYYTGHVKDEFGTRLAKSVPHYRHVLDTAARVADVVLADALDVLIHPEVGMDVSSYLLAAMRLAPVQCAGWGHPVTTGHATIDYFLTCEEMEPPQARAHYREKLAPLPGLGTNYPRPCGASDKSRAELGLPAGHAYLCPQSLFKIHPDNDALFAAIAAADASASLVFFRDNDAPLTKAFATRLAKAGIASRQVVFLERMAHADYLRANALSDVMLDTLHWSGGNTSLDALAMGLPVVSLPGAFMRGRQSLAMLRRVGVEELVAADTGDYVRIATRVATDPSHRKDLSRRILEGGAQLFDDERPVRALEAFLASTHAP
jgi:protein O-GlcNAc transferase